MLTPARNGYNIRDPVLNYHPNSSQSWSPVFCYEGLGTIGHPTVRFADMQWAMPLVTQVYSWGIMSEAEEVEQYEWVCSFDLCSTT